MQRKPAADAVLAEVSCTWQVDREQDSVVEQARAVVLHSARGVLVLEAVDPRVALPTIGTEVHVEQKAGVQVSGRLAEHGRGGRFLLSLGDRPVRRSSRLKISRPGTVRSAALPGAVAVEVVDLTTGGARVRGVELPVGSQVTLEFTPPYREEPVSVRAIVAHGTHGAEQPWIGVVFRLVAMRGGR